MEKSKSNFNLTEKAIKSLKTRQTQVKHIIKPTYGDISTFKGGWEAFTDQMVTDLNLLYSSHPLSTNPHASLKMQEEVGPL